jgi:two-component system OmpR family sensor kinase/two-component system sensor histidine kinase BaeS
MFQHPSPQKTQRISRLIRLIISMIIFLLLSMGGASVFLFLFFSEYIGSRNSWLLLFVPFAVIAMAIIAAYLFYTRFGRPFGQIFNAIDSVAKGDLSVRVPVSDSPQLQELTQRFNKMLSELERAEQQRRNLTADIAHELRTPLHIIQGNLEGIIDGVYQPTPEHINTTLEETKLLARLVNDLQTLSLAETGQLPLHPICFLLADLIDDLTSSFSSEAASLGIDLKTSITDQNQELTADYDRLNQVLSNLISNALRHTPSGGTLVIHTESLQEESRTANFVVRITIQDTGSGIPVEDLPFIFDRFWRGDKSRSERTHSGLGLAIAKQLIRAHGGTIAAQSVVGTGSNFVIELPDYLQHNIN